MILVDFDKNCPMFDKVRLFFEDDGSFGITLLDFEGVTFSSVYQQR